METGYKLNLSLGSSVTNIFNVPCSNRSKSPVY